MVGMPYCHRIGHKRGHNVPQCASGQTGSGQRQILTADGKIHKLADRILILNDKIEVFNKVDRIRNFVGILTPTIERDLHLIAIQIRDRFDGAAVELEHNV